MENGNGWDQWRNHILFENKRLSDGQDKLREAIEKLANEFTEFRVAMVDHKAESRGVSRAYTTVVGFLGGIIAYVVGHIVTGKFFTK